MKAQRQRTIPKEQSVEEQSSNYYETEKTAESSRALRRADGLGGRGFLMWRLEKPTSDQELTSSPD